MAKIQIKYEKPTPFGGIFSIMDTALSFEETISKCKIAKVLKETIFRGVKV